MEDRQVVNGMVYKIRTGVSRRDLPERYGRGKRSTPASAATPWEACSPEALQQIQAHADAAGDID